jgi:hypothetical protein
VVELEVVEDGTLGDYVLEQPPQVRDVLLAVPKFVNEAVFSFFGRDVEGLIESAIGGLDAERSVEDQEGLADRVHDVLGVVLDILNQRSSFHYGRPAWIMSCCTCVLACGREFPIPGPRLMCSFGRPNAMRYSGSLLGLVLQP